MSIPLFVTERSKPEMTTQPLSVGCLIYERMDQIDLLKVLPVSNAFRDGHSSCHPERSRGIYFRLLETFDGS